jgi:hypothetical protein
VRCWASAAQGAEQLPGQLSGHPSPSTGVRSGFWLFFGPVHIGPRVAAAWAMRVHGTVGGLVLTLGLTASHAYAQAVERVAALQPTVNPPEATPPPVARAPETAAPPPPVQDASPSATPVPVPTVAAPAPAPSPPPAPAPAPPPPPASVAPAPPPIVGLDARAKDSPARPVSSEPIRSRRKLALLGEVGWNSLGGVGAMLTYNVHPHFALDLAGGASLSGWKTGLRGRYNLLTGAFTPFIGAGLSMSSGVEGARFGRDGDDSRDDHDYENFDPEREAKYDVRRSGYAQAVIGFELMHRHGFTWQVSGGYSWLLNRDNFTYLEGKRDDDLAKVLFGSGPVAAMAFGYAF